MLSHALSLQMFAQRCEASLPDMTSYHQSPGQHPSMCHRCQAPVTLRNVHIEVIQAEARRGSRPKESGLRWMQQPSGRM